jgi:hypothetical protein
VDKHRIKRYRTSQQLIPNSAATPQGNQMEAEINTPAHDQTLTTPEDNYTL